ncbi:MAG: hypothetical protein ACHP93_03050 [Solirubrobacterales bacterium]
MNRSMRGLRSALAALCLTLALLTVPASAGATEAVHYTAESMAAFEQQMNTGQIQTAVFNRKVRSIRLTLKSSEHVLVHYPKGHAPALEATLKAKHVAVSQLSEALANKELKAKPVHHKLRYIAGGIVIAVIVVVGAVLLINRRRQPQLD